jgi:hypothetical protein
VRWIGCPICWEPASRCPVCKRVQACAEDENMKMTYAALSRMLLERHPAVCGECRRPKKDCPSRRKPYRCPMPCVMIGDMALPIWWKEGAKSLNQEERKKCPKNTTKK